MLNTQRSHLVKVSTANRTEKINFLIYYQLVPWGGLWQERTSFSMRSWKLMSPEEHVLPSFIFLEGDQGVISQRNTQQLAL